MESNNTFKILTINIGYLFRTVVVRNNLNYEHFKDIQDDDPEYDIPEIGHFNSQLNKNNWFTILPYNSYGDTYTVNDYAFLQYTVKKPLKLINKSSFYDQKTIFEYINKYDLDGYIGREDIHEIYLVNPDKCVYTEIIQLPYLPIAKSNKLIQDIIEDELNYIKQNILNVEDSKLYVNVDEYSDTLIYELYTKYPEFKYKTYIYIPTDPLSNSIFGISVPYDYNLITECPYNSLINI